MKRQTIALALLSVLLLAGCLGGPGSEPGTDAPSDVSPEDVPGVTGGSLTNASALLEANQNAVIGNGAIFEVNQSAKTMDFGARVVVGANFSTYRISGSGTTGSGQSTTVDQWGNETTQIVRTSFGEQTDYRVLDRPDDRLTVLSGLYEFLSAADFGVSNETTGDGTVVLTAAHTAPESGSGGAMDSIDGRLVVDESGQIRNFSVSAAQDRETVTYSYRLVQAGVDTVPKPDWIAEVPPGATVQAQLTVDVANSSYLVLEHEGGDDLPSGTSVQVESNGTADAVSLASQVSAGETRYVYRSADSGSLQLSTDRPASNSVAPLTSPVSVRITSDGGAVLHSGGLGWDSTSASDEGSGSASGSTSDSSTSETTEPTPSNEIAR